MLDTIVLSLDQPQFEVLEPGRFSPSAQGLLAPPYYPLGARGNFQCTQNPTKADLEGGRYLPRLTLTKRTSRAGFAVTLRVEFSAPKLIFGNNFDELRSMDFDRVRIALRTALLAMGIRVAEPTLAAARVSAIHFSKNIALRDFTTVSMAMGELERIDLTARLDLAKTDYRNGGHAIRYHANSYEVAFYDKVKDLLQARISQKRSIEPDSRAQLDLLANLLPKHPEVLRFEVRLGNRTKIVKTISAVGVTAGTTFAALFDAGVAKAVLLGFWANIRKQLPLAAMSRSTRPEDLILRLAAQDKVPRAGALLQRLGGLVLAESVGLRGFGALMGRYGSQRTIQRLRRQLKDIAVSEPGGFQALAEVDDALERFEPLRLADFDFGLYESRRRDRGAAA